MNIKIQRQQGKGAIEIIEEATHLLRLLPVHIFASYYVGSLPFILGFLYFWTDMSRGAFAYRHSAEAAFSIALLFLWMKCWQTFFSRQLKAHICNEPPPRWSFLRIIRLGVVQTAIQPSGLIALPIAMLIGLPFGWVYAFYQNVSVFGHGETNDIKAIYKKSWQHAMLFPKQNHIFLFVFSFFGIFVFLNLCIVIYLAPQLLNMLFGVETLFTKAGWIIFNTTFLAVVYGVLYLLLDPLVKTVYMLRCFYGESLQTGEDLKVELKNFQPVTKIALVLLVLSLGWHGVISSNAALASEKTTPFSIRQSTKTVIPVSDLDRSISEVISKREYTWRIPREKLNKGKNKGLIAVFIEGVINTLRNWFRPVKQWLKKIIDWVGEHLLRWIKIDRGSKPMNSGWTKSVHVLMYVLLSLVACALALLFWRMWKGRRSQRVGETGEAVVHTPDLTDDNVAADELPANSWLKLARELMEQGNLRLALRALYLASLSHMAQQGIITIAGFKSNRDYEMELRRKAHAMPDLRSAFAQNVRIFESIWYGMHEVTGEIVTRFNKNQERIMTFAEKY